VVGNEAADVVARLFSRSPRPDHLSTLKLGPLPELPSRWSERLPHLAAGRFGLSLGPSQFARITRTIIDWKMSDRRRATCALACLPGVDTSIRLRIWGTHYPGGVDPDWQTALDY
ncbi:hypothetical protein FOZ62_019248, partial [Perkinsus olseni]